MLRSGAGNGTPVQGGTTPETGIGQMQLYKTGSSFQRIVIDIAEPFTWK
jgi:hypothetical protein